MPDPELVNFELIGSTSDVQIINILDQMIARNDPVIKSDDLRAVAMWLMSRVDAVEYLEVQGNG